MSKHTPGPWRAAVRRGYAAVASGPQTDTVMVADCRTVDVDLPTATANACLIAAAPDLLEALKILLADMDAEYRDRNGDADHDGMDLARAAIAKATGQ